jgi:hypothetical protein
MVMLQLGSGTQFVYKNARFVVKFPAMNRARKTRAEEKAGTRIREIHAGRADFAARRIADDLGEFVCRRRMEGRDRPVLIESRRSVPGIHRNRQAGIAGAEPMGHPLPAVPNLEPAGAIEREHALDAVGMALGGVRESLAQREYPGRADVGGQLAVKVERHCPEGRLGLARIVAKLDEQLLGHFDEGRGHGGGRKLAGEAAHDLILVHAAPRLGLLAAGRQFRRRARHLKPRPGHATSAS